MTVPSPIQEMHDSHEEYLDFDNGQKLTDAQNLKKKLDAFDSASGNPEVLLMVFFMYVMVAGDTPMDGLPGGNSSVARGQENDLTEVKNELNYASAYRDTVSEIKNQLQLGKTPAGGGSTTTVIDDCYAMESFRTSGFGPNAPQIFQDSDTTFKGAEADLVSVARAVEENYGGSFANLWKAAQQQGDKTAGGLIQTFTNATDTLYSAVGVQQNVLGTQMQDLESTYKSYLSVVTQAIKSLFTTINNSIQKETM